MVFSNKELLHYYNDVVNKYGKIKSEINKNRLSKIRRGVYSNDVFMDRLFIANKMIEDSYISYEYALYYYGLIPEKVCVITSASKNKNRKNVICTKNDKYLYRDIPDRCFNEGITCIVDEGKNNVRIATKEKALCDRLSMVPQIRTLKDMSELLFEDLRIDDDDFYRLNLNELVRLARYYNKPTLRTLIKFINKTTKYESNY